MRNLSNLLRSLYQLTGISAFNSIANSLYDIERTKSRIDRVKKDAQKLKQDNKKENVG